MRPTAVTEPPTAQEPNAGPVGIEKETCPITRVGLGYPDVVETNDHRAGVLRRLDEASQRMVEWNEPRGPREARRRSEQCPIPATHDRLEEAHYFLHRVLVTIHHPDEFRWNLNAFLQACRSVLHLARSELGKKDDFADWWKIANDELDRDQVVRRVIDSRNLVVHERMLNQSSHVSTGVFRGSKMKVAIGGELPNDWYSEALLRYTASVWTGVFLDAEHSSIGEQFGVMREWHVAELGDGDVADLCDDVYGALSHFAAEAHRFAGVDMPPEVDDPQGAHDADSYNLLVETDLDPSLAEKWWGKQQDRRPNHRIRLVIGRVPNECNPARSCSYASDCGSEGCGFKPRRPPLRPS